MASFEDLAIALDQRLGEDRRRGRARGRLQELREDDIESLRDLASGAPVVRAVNDLLEKAVELRASDIHIEPFHDRTRRCACGSTACCGRLRRPPACCRKP